MTVKVQNKKYGTNFLFIFGCVGNNHLRFVVQLLAEIPERDVAGTDRTTDMMDAARELVKASLNAEASEQEWFAAGRERGEAATRSANGCVWQWDIWTSTAVDCFVERQWFEFHLVKVLVWMKCVLRLAHEAIKLLNSDGVERLCVRQ